MKAGLSRIYGWLLKLYPQSFQREFADEMQTVFSQRLDDVYGWELLEVVLLEMIYLVPNILREHRTQRQLIIANSGGVMSVFKPQSFYRWSMGGSILLGLIALVLVVTPFFLNGIHQYSYDSIYNALYDPKGFAPFNQQIGNYLHFLSFLTVLLIPVWCGVMTLGLSVSLFRNWQKLDARWRLGGLVSLGIACLMGVLWMLPFTQKMIIWILD